MLRNYNHQVFRLFKQQYGLGIIRGRLILILCGINLNFNLRIKRFTRKYRRRISLFLRYKHWILMKQLKHQRIQKFYFYKNLNNFYKYYRLKFGLPLNGQRTHSNRQSSKSFFKNNQIFLNNSRLSILSKEGSISKKKYRKEINQRKRLKFKRKFVKYVRSSKKKIKL